MSLHLVNITQESITTYEPFDSRGKFKTLGTSLTNHSCIHGSIEIKLKRGTEYCYFRPESFVYRYDP